MNLVAFGISLLVAGVIAAIGSFVFKLSFFVLFCISIIALILNGFIAEHEDNEPGGFNNHKTNKKK